MVLVRRVDVFGEFCDHVLEGKQDPWIDLQCQVQVEGPAATLLRVEIDLPNLSQGVGFHEMAFIVDMKSVVHRMIFEIGNVPGDVDDCHEATE